jgi:hypothetical protein
MSTSSLPGSMKPFPVRAAPVRPPVLASDILREEVAPKAPARRAIRLALVVAAAAFLVATGLSMSAGPMRLPAPWAVEVSVLSAVLALIAAAVPLPYAARSGLAALAGAVPLVLGAAAIGPLAKLAAEGPMTAFSLVALGTVLPGALVFRARYRALGAARSVLAVALVTALPAAALLALRAIDGGGDTVDRALSAVGLASVAASTLGFMGAETSAGCAQWAAVIVGSVAARPTAAAVLATWGGRDGEIAPWMAAAIGELLCASLVAFALFQLLAAALGGQARQVDVHQIVGASASPDESERDERDDGDDD